MPTVTATVADKAGATGKASASFTVTAAAKILFGSSDAQSGHDAAAVARVKARYPHAAGVRCYSSSAPYTVPTGLAHFGSWKSAQSDAADSTFMAACGATGGRAFWNHEPDNNYTGSDLTSPARAAWLAQWQARNQHLASIAGGQYLATCTTAFLFSPGQPLGDPADWYIPGQPFYVDMDGAAFGKNGYVTQEASWRNFVAFLDAHPDITECGVGEFQSPYALTENADDTDGLHAAYLKYDVNLFRTVQPKFARVYAVMLYEANAITGSVFNETATWDAICAS